MAFLLLVVSAGAAGKPFTLVIDAGHGGGDAGACGAISQEKHLTLKFALAFGRLVEKNCPDVKVIYTRKTDKFVELYRRAEIANQNKADLFISVHINSLPKGHVARGFQTYTLGRSRRTGKKTGVQENLEVAKRENAVIYKEANYKQRYGGLALNSPESDILFEFIQDKNMANSVELAKFMQRHVCQATGRQDLGAHQDNLAVLRLTSMPGCLIELGFISTRDEEQFMNTAAATEKYARGIYNAFVAYRKNHGSSIKVPYLPEPKEDKVEIPQIVPQKSEPQPKDKPKKQDKEQQAEQQLKQANEQQAAPVAPAEGTEVKPETPQPAKGESPAAKGNAPVFKVQIIAGQKRLKPGDARFKGLKDVECFEESGMVKYTVGSSANYAEIYQLRKDLLSKFPEAFIIAFKNGNKMNVQEAIREYRNNKQKK